VVTATSRTPGTEDVSPAAQIDQRVLLRDVPWSVYQSLVAVRGEKATPRLSFFRGTLEIMGPSSSHERIKSRIGHLVEVYLLHHDIDFEAVGSWTLQDESEESGAEPDECYLLGPKRREEDEQRPDLAIEVEWTRGGVDKRPIYARLGVREVWIWKRGQIAVHELAGEQYEPRDASVVLPGIDLELLVRHLDHERASDAIKAYRAALSTT